LKFEQALNEKIFFRLDIRAIFEKANNRRNNKMRLSIIVPVFNVENYISKCVESLLNQDIPTDEYEIILVNDGSTDGSLKICNYYVENYSNIKIVSQKNQGLGAARNAGIEASKGDAILFVDSDDYLKQMSLNTLLKTFELQNLDVLRFNYEAISAGGEIIPKKMSSNYSTIYSKSVVDGKTFLANYLGWACYVWVFLFKRELIKTNQLHFNSDIYYEDVEWLPRVLLLSQRVCSVEDVIYFYLQRSGSITKGADEWKKNKTLADKLFIINMLKNLSIGVNDTKVRAWCQGLISLTVVSLLSLVENELPVKKTELIGILKKAYLPLKGYQFTPKQWRDIFIINISPRLFCFLKRKRD